MSDNVHACQAGTYHTGNLEQMQPITHVLFTPHMHHAMHMEAIHWDHGGYRCLLIDQQMPRLKLAIALALQYPAPVSHSASGQLSPTCVKATSTLNIHPQLIHNPSQCPLFTYLISWQEDGRVFNTAQHISSKLKDGHTLAR